MLAYTRAETLLKIDHVTLQFGAKVVLRDVCAEIANITREDCVEGQVVCFLGPSGVGKTQLSRILAGLSTPTSGTVTLAHDQPVQRGQVGMVPQNYVLFEYLTVRDNLAVAARQGQRPVDGHLLADLGLTEHLDKYPAQLSGGTRQRVAIVRQILCSNHYLVMDEPFSGLDPLMKAKATALIRHVAQLDDLNTIILVTHDVTEGMSVADTVWLMGNPDGTGANIVEQYDLAAMGLAWRPDIQDGPQFQALVRDVKARFRTLIPQGA